MDICKPKAGETVVVSGAAGAVGIVVDKLLNYKAVVSWALQVRMKKKTID
jgi:NADPH-dependent curcumin reductase CurA